MSTTPKRKSLRLTSLRPAATKGKFRRISRSGSAAVICAILALSIAGCVHTKKKDVIATETDQLPHLIKKGEPSQFEGYVLPTPLFNRLTPCFKDVLENPPAAEEPKPLPEPKDSTLQAPPPRRLETDKIAFRRAR